MTKKRQKPYSVQEWEEIENMVKLLRQQHGEDRGCHNRGDLVSVDYFALGDVLDYFDNAHDDLVRLVRCRTILDDLR